MTRPVRWPRGLLAILALLCAASSAHAAIHPSTDGNELAAAFAPGLGATGILTGQVEVFNAGVVDDAPGALGHAIVLSTGLAVQAGLPNATVVNFDNDRPGVSFLEEVAGAGAGSSSDGVLLTLFLTVASPTQAAFEFVFATDETNATSNDAFAARLIPPGGQAGPNIALFNGGAMTVVAAPLAPDTQTAFDRLTQVVPVSVSLLPGQNQLLFMISDIGNGSGDSAVYLANLHALTIPEPASAALLGLGLAALAVPGARRRYGRNTAGR